MRSFRHCPGVGAVYAIWGADADLRARLRSLSAELRRFGRRCLSNLIRREVAVRTHLKLRRLYSLSEAFACGWQFGIVAVVDDLT
jgi:hypothetical protein